MSRSAARQCRTGEAFRAIVDAVQVALAIAAAVLFGVLATVVAFPQAALAADEQFVLLADTHLGQPDQPAYEEVEQALLWASELPDLKAVCVAGDLTDRGDAVAFSEWEYLCDSILDGAKHIQALGDHDTGKNGAYLKVDPTLTVQNGYRYFKQVNGGVATTFTQFENANVMTFGGISARGHAVVSWSMLKSLDARLRKTARNGKVAVVICHYPIDSASLNMRSKLMGVLRSYPNVIYVSGDKHRYSASKLCRTVAPSCARTPYARAGYDRATKYSFTSVGVNACSSYRSGNYSYADVLGITANGKVTLSKWNLTKQRVDKVWKLSQPKSYVKVKSAPATATYPTNAKFTYRITFSDGKPHGGVESGSTFELRAGASRKFGPIPSGVLVKVRAVNVPKNWSRPSTRVIEVAKTSRTVNMKSRYTSAKKSKLRAAAKP